METPTRAQGRGRPPNGAVMLLTVEDAREDDENEFDALMDIYRGFMKLRDRRTVKALRRQRWVPAGGPSIMPELDRAA